MKDISKMSSNELRNEVARLRLGEDKRGGMLARSETITLRVTIDTKNALMLAAYDGHMTMSRFIEMILREKLGV